MGPGTGGLGSPAEGQRFIKRMDDLFECQTGPFAAFYPGRDYSPIIQVYDEFDHVELGAELVTNPAQNLFVKRPSYLLNDPLKPFLLTIFA